MRDYERPPGARVEDWAASREKTADSEPPVDLRLTRKLADVIDGVDLTGRAVGDVFKLPASEARLLIAEGWAVEDTKRRQETD
jgi:hypothetical protein